MWSKMKCALLVRGSHVRMDLREGQFCLFFQKNWLFDLKKWGNFLVIWKSKGCESAVGDSWIWLTGLLRQIRRPEGGNRPIFRAFCNMKLPNFYKPNDHFFRKKRQNCPSPFCGKFRKILFLRNFPQSGDREFCHFFQKMWLFDLKNWGKILLYERRKDGHLRTPRLQFLRRDQRGLLLFCVVIDSQFVWC